jgi:hypothetical protein
MSHTQAPQAAYVVWQRGKQDSLIEAKFPKAEKTRLFLRASFPLLFRFPLLHIAEHLQRKGQASFLFSRISYGAQELAVFLLENSPSDIKRHSSKGRKRIPSPQTTGRDRRKTLYVNTRWLRTSAP